VNRPSAPFLSISLLVAWGFGLTAQAGAPDYDAFSEPDGAIVTEHQQAALIALVRSPEQLEAVYADAAKGNERAKHVWQQLEATFTAAGEGVADRATRPGCLVPGYRELSRSCIPDWSFLSFLAQDRPGAARLRRAIFAAFAARARANGLENQIVLSVVNGLVSVRRQQASQGAERPHQGVTVSTRKRFQFEFDDEGPRTFTFDYAGEHAQQLDVRLEDGVPALYANQQACALLARIFGKLALSSYEPGFHLHIEKDFQAEGVEVMRITLIGDTK